MHGAVEDITVAPGQALPLSLALPSDDAAARAAIGPVSVCSTWLPDAVTIPVYATLWRAVWATSIAVCICGSHRTGQVRNRRSDPATLGRRHGRAHLPASWLSTGNALEGIAFQAKDAVLVVDDFCPAGVKADIARQHKEADRLLRAQGNRRLAAHACGQHPPTIQASTGPDPLHG